MITLNNVSKSFREKKILDSINLKISSGEVVGIVGGNGCGKSTILKIICGLLYADDGEVIVLEKILKPSLIGKTPNNIGILIESPKFLPNYSGIQNLRLLSSIQNKIDKQAIIKTMDIVNLNSNDPKKVRNYSQGMKQRLGIAQAIMEQPQILLLDEPTNGLDKNGVQMLKDVVLDHKNKGVATVLVSHLQSDIDALCDSVYLLENAKLIPHQREKSWLIVVQSLSDLESLNANFPNLQLGERHNGLLTGVITGVWENTDIAGLYLREKGISFVEVKEADSNANI